MDKIKRLIAVLLCGILVLGIAALTGCSSAEEPGKILPGEVPDDDDPEDDDPSDDPSNIENGIYITAFNGATVDILAPKLREYLDEDDFDKQCSFLVENKLKVYDSQCVFFEWGSAASSNFTVKIADNKNFTDAIVLKTRNYDILPGFLIPGKTYYWRVEDETTYEHSKTDSFTVKDSPVRIISMDGAFNVRDLGGWTAADGKTVKYGLLYRGGKINSGNATTLTVEGKNIYENILKIKGEIDLRGSDDYGQTQNCVNSANPYLKAPYTGYTTIFPEFSQKTPVNRVYDAKSAGSMKAIFEFLADESNYPVYFHCNAGADRTGTLAFLINGLLGVSYEDLTRDFEITSFSSQNVGNLEQRKRWRGSEENFRDGVMQDTSGNYVAWGKMYEFLMEHYGAGTTLSGAIENYLTTACSVAKSDLDKIRAIMLG